MKKLLLFLTTFAMLCAVGCECPGGNDTNPDDKPNTEDPNNSPSPNYFIEYQTTDGNTITPNNTNAFGTEILSNTYEQGVGKIGFGEPVVSIGYAAFYDCSTLVSISIPDSVTSFGEGAFCGCSSLTNIDIPNEATEIANHTFDRCSSLTRVFIPDGVTAIGDGSFNNCEKLESISIPNSVISIGAYAFHYCQRLTSLTIPESVTSIGIGAFQDCFSLASVYCTPSTPPSAGELMFSGRPVSGRKIYVPTKSVNAYKSAKGWSDYAEDIVGYDF